MARGIPVCPQLIVGVLPRPPSARLAMAAPSFARYSGTSGACCPALGGLLGSHRLVLRSVQRPDQSGYFHCAHAGTLRPHSTATSVIEKIELREIMSVFPAPPRPNLVGGEVIRSLPGTLSSASRARAGMR